VYEVSSGERGKGDRLRMSIERERERERERDGGDAEISTWGRFEGG
jgi:hypothetical protein